VELLHAAGHLMNQQLDAEGGLILKRSVEALGIHVHTDARSTAVTGDQRVTGVTPADGRTIPADLVVIAAFTTSQVTLVAAVIVSGAFIGLNNTLTTQAVMLIAPVERPVASAAYGFVRFIGGGLAPYFAARMAAALNVHVPFYVGAVAVLAGLVVLRTGHAQLTRAEQELAAAEAEAGLPSTGPEPEILAPGGADIPG